MSLVKVAVFSLNEPVFKMRKNIDDAIDFAKMRVTNKNMATAILIGHTTISEKLHIL